MLELWIAKGIQVAELACVVIVMLVPISLIGAFLWWASDQRLALAQNYLQAARQATYNAAIELYSNLRSLYGDLFKKFDLKLMFVDNELKLTAKLDSIEKKFDHNRWNLEKIEERTTTELSQLSQRIEEYVTDVSDIRTINISKDVAQANIDNSFKRWSALSTTIFLLIMVLLGIIINTFLLSKVFDELSDMRIYGYKIGLALAFIYTITELGFGVVMRAFGQAQDKLSPRSFALFAIFCFMTFACVAFETFVYVLVSVTGTASDVLPLEWVTAVPALKGWLGVFGFFISSVLIVIGYTIKMEWDLFLEHSTVHSVSRSMKKAEDLTKRLPSLHGEIADQLSRATAALKEFRKELKDEPPPQLARIGASIRDGVAELRDAVANAKANREDRLLYAPANEDEAKRTAGIAILLAVVVLGATIMLAAELADANQLHGIIAGYALPGVGSIVIAGLLISAGYMILNKVQLAKGGDTEFRLLTRVTSPGTMLLAIVLLLSAILFCSLSLSGLLTGESVRYETLFRGGFASVGLFMLGPWLESIQEALKVLAIIGAQLIVSGILLFGCVGLELLWIAIGVIRFFFWVSGAPVVWLFQNWGSARKQLQPGLQIPAAPEVHGEAA